jgi:hypothetical protein
MTDLTHARWRKSSRSGGNNGQCVELADLGPGLAVRDSKYPSGPALVVGPSAGAAFLSLVKSVEAARRS